MSITIQMPERALIQEGSTPSHGTFVLQPLEEGYGVTIGNAFRRVLLSSIPGAAIVGVNIRGVLHEFQTIPGVSEDMAEIILNFKGLRLRLIDKDVQSIDAKFSGPMKLTGADIQSATDQVEILNPEHHIATLAADAELDLSLLIGRGRGYVPSDENRNPEHPAGTIAIDAIYTPIVNVKYTVEPFRVGQKTDYEKLSLEIITDGSITAEEAVEHAAKILRDHINLFIHFEFEDKPAPADEAREAEVQRIRRILLTQVDDLELSVRSHNCLKAANIMNLADLVRRQESDMLKFRNFGRKSLGELMQIVQNLGLSFGMDVAKYLTEEEMKQFVD